MTAGVHRGPGLGAAVAAAAGAVPVAWLLARFGHGMPTSNPLRDLPLLALLAVAEEVVFRGGLQSWLATKPVMARRRLGVSTANAVTSVVFSAAHLGSHAPLQALGVFPVSLLLGASLERSGRLWVPAALHVWFNLALYGASWAQRSL